MMEQQSSTERRSEPQGDQAKRPFVSSALDTRGKKLRQDASAQTNKKVRFDSSPEVYYFEANEQPETAANPSELVPSTHLSSQLSLLSSTHGRARRQLRDISKQTLRDCVKYGVKTRGRTVRGETRWRFQFGNTVFITDATCTQEITSYKLAVSIEPASISQEMRDAHTEVSRTLRNNFSLCTTHSIIIVDQR